MEKVLSTADAVDAGAIGYKGKLDCKEKRLVTTNMSPLGGYCYTAWVTELPLTYVMMLCGPYFAPCAGYGCMHLGTVVHEMLHAAGFWHEQSRPDRDSYVAIHWQNIKRGREDNFARYSRGEVSTLQLPYDTASIMHYQSKAFSRNGRATIVAKTKGEVLGQRDGFSPMDLQKLNKLYECDGNESEMTGLTTTTTGTSSNAARSSKMSRFPLW